MRKKTQPAASRTYSIKTQSVTLLTSGLILLIALLLFSNLYGAFDSNKKIAASNERTLTYTAAQIEDNLSNVNNMMLSILSSNTGLQTLTAGTDSLNAHTVTQELVSQFQRLLRVYPFCDAFLSAAPPAAATGTCSATPSSTTGSSGSGSGWKIPSAAIRPATATAGSPTRSTGNPI